MNQVAHSHAFRGLSCLLAVIVLVTTPGCAAKQVIFVNSRPAGARIAVGNDNVGTAPMALRVKKTDELVLRLEKDGYRPAEVLLESRRSWTGLLLTMAAGAIGTSIAYFLGCATWPRSTVGG